MREETPESVWPELATPENAFSTSSIISTQGPSHRRSAGPGAPAFFGVVGDGPPGVDPGFVPDIEGVDDVAVAIDDHADVVGVVAVQGEVDSGSFVGVLNQRKQPQKTGLAGVGPVRLGPGDHETTPLIANRAAPSGATVWKHSHPGYVPWAHEKRPATSVKHGAASTTSFTPGLPRKTKKRRDRLQTSATLARIHETRKIPRFLSFSAGSGALLPKP